MTIEAPAKPEKKDDIKKEPTPTPKAEDKKPDTTNKAGEAKKDAGKPAGTNEKPVAPKTKKKTNSGSGGGKTIATLALLTSLSAIVGGYWLWQQIDIALDYTQQVSDEVKTSLESAKASIDNSARTQAAQLTGDVKGLTQRQQGIETQLGNLMSRIGNTTRDWNLSEAAYLLQIANHKLQLQRDIKTAITALTLADVRIRTTGEPAMLPVRELISKEVTQLEAFKETDLTGISLKLSAITDEIGKMPLRVRVKQIDEKTAKVDTQSDSSDDIANLPTAIWNSLKGLITVRYNERPVEALLTPSQVSNLEENLQIKLEQSRLALLQNDQQLFEHNLDKSLEWLKAFYNTEDERVSSALTQLESIRTTKLAPELPDISGSLRKLKSLAKKINITIDDKKEGGA